MIKILTVIGFALLVGCVQTATKEEENNEPLTSEAISFEVKELPSKPMEFKELNYKGKVIDTKRWTDKEGYHLILFTEDELEEGITGDETYRLIKKEIYAYHYLQKGESFELVWRIYDFIKAEDWMDMVVKFYPETFEVTDLDEDGYAETKFIYSLFAATDYSPATVKLMMHESGIKYALRGEQFIDYGNNNTAGGNFTHDVAFNDAPPSFLKSATAHWEKYKTLKFEE